MSRPPSSLPVTVEVLVLGLGTLLAGSLSVWVFRSIMVRFAVELLNQPEPVTTLLVLGIFLASFVPVAGFIVWYVDTFRE